MDGKLFPGQTTDLISNTIYGREWREARGRALDENFGENFMKSEAKESDRGSGASNRRSEVTVARIWQRGCIRETHKIALHDFGTLKVLVPRVRECTHSPNRAGA